VAPQLTLANFMLRVGTYMCAFHNDMLHNEIGKPYEKHGIFPKIVDMVIWLIKYKQLSNDRSVIWRRVRV
jgi:hypothetical protein